MMDMIERIIDEKIRPMLLGHGGDIIPVSIDDGIFRFRLTGECASCPGADITISELIEKELISTVSGITRVELVSQVSDELLEQARSILRNSRPVT